MGKRLIQFSIFLVFACVAFSCSTLIKSRTNKENTTQTISGTFSGMSQTSHMETRNIESVLDSLFSAKSFYFEIYDTSKVDSAGSSPIAMRGLITEETHREITTTKTDTIVVEKKDTSFVNTTKTETVSKKKDTRYGLSFTEQILAVLFVSAIFYIWLFTNRKRT